MGLKVIVTGSTGMVGEGVMMVCLDSPAIDEVLVINRRSDGVKHPKLKEVILEDFMQLETIADQLIGYDACYHCMGISSVGVEMDKYEIITRQMSLKLGKIVSEQNKNAVFTYVSGGGTDETETSRMEWSRIKGNTENQLAAMPFRKFYAYRAGFIKPYPGQKHAHPFYKYINWTFPIGQALAPNAYNTMEELGKSMIQLTLHPIARTIIRGKYISEEARKI